MKYLKLFGLQRTGTNYLAWLLENNFRDVCVLQGILAWKHGPIDISLDGSTWTAPDGLSRPPMPDEIAEFSEIRAAWKDGRLGYLFTVKDPYAWLLSFTKYSAAKGERVLVVDEIGRWNVRTREYLDFSREHPDSAILVRYEDLLQGHVEVLHSFARTFRLSRRAGRYVTTNRVFRAGGDSLKGDAALTDLRFDPSFYVERRYLSFFPPDLLGVIRRVVDRDLCDVLGYAVL